MGTFDENGVCFANRRAPLETQSLRAGDESAFLVRLKATEPVYRNPPPKLGEHSDAVRAWLAAG